MDKRIDGVVSMIDGALEDYAVSGDAMRWRPEAPPARSVRVNSPGGMRGIRSDHAFLDEAVADPRALRDVQVLSVSIVPGGPGAVSVEMGRPDPMHLEFRSSLTPEQLAELRDVWQASVARFVRQVAAMMDAIGEGFAEMGRGIMAAARAQHEVLCDAGLIEEPLPTEGWARALELKRRRGTGPDRQLQHQRRPRQIQ